jgi:GAF domain-containing protein
MVHVLDLGQVREEFARTDLLAEEGFVSYIGVPLVAKGELKGVLEIFHCAELHPDREWLDFLDTLAGQAAIAIDNGQLFEGLRRSNLELELAYDGTIEGCPGDGPARPRDRRAHTTRHRPDPETGESDQHERMAAGACSPRGTAA